MIKAILLALLVVAGPVQAQFAYACGVMEEPAGSCCGEMEGAAGMAADCDTHGGSERDLSCAELGAHPCMEPGASEPAQWVRSVSSSERDVDRHMPPAAASHPADPFPAFALQVSVCCSRSPVASLGAGEDTYLVTQRLRI